MTLTYNVRSTVLATGIHAAERETELGTGTGSLAAHGSNNVGGGTSRVTHVWTTAAGVPGIADWGNGTYRCILNMSGAGANCSYGLLGTGHFARVDSGLTTDTETVTQAESAFTGTGLKTATASWNPAAGSTADRFEVALEVANAGTMNETIIVIVNDGTSYVDGAFDEAGGPATSGEAGLRGTSRALIAAARGSTAQGAARASARLAPSAQKAGAGAGAERARGTGSETARSARAQLGHLLARAVLASPTSPTATGTLALRAAGHMAAVTSRTATASCFSRGAGAMAALGRRAATAATVARAVGGSSMTAAKGGQATTAERERARIAAAGARASTAVSQVQALARQLAISLPTFAAPVRAAAAGRVIAQARRGGTGSGALVGTARPSASGSKGARGTAASRAAGLRAAVGAAARASVARVAALGRGTSSTTKLYQVVLRAFGYGTAIGQRSAPTATGPFSAQASISQPVAVGALVEVRAAAALEQAAVGYGTIERAWATSRAAVLTGWGERR